MTSDPINYIAEMQTESVVPAQKAEESSLQNSSLQASLASTALLKDAVSSTTATLSSDSYNVTAKTLQSLSDLQNKISAHTQTVVQEIASIKKQALDMQTQNQKAQNAQQTTAEQTQNQQAKNIDETVKALEDLKNKETPLISQFTSDLHAIQNQSILPSDQITSSIDNLKNTAILGNQKITEAFNDLKNTPAFQSAQVANALADLIQTQSTTMQQLLTSTDALKIALAFNASQVLNATDTSASARQKATQAQQDLVTAMVAALQQLELILSQNTKSRFQWDAQIANAQIALQQKIAADQAEKLRQQEQTSFWTKLFGWIIAIVVSAVACLFGQFWVAAIAITMATLSSLGAFEWIAKQISSVLQSMGMSKLTADIMAAVIVIVVVVALTIAAAPASAASQAANLGIGAAEAAEAATTAASSILSRALNILSNIAEKLNRLNPLRYLSTSTNMGIMTGATVASQLNLNEIINEIPGLSAKEKEIIQQLLSAVLAIVMVLSMVNVGSGIASTGSKIPNFLRSPEGIALAQKIKTGLLAIQMGAQMGEGATQIAQGIIMKELANDEADLELLQVLTDMLTALSSTSLKQGLQLLEQHANADLDTQKRVFSGLDAVTQLILHTKV